MFSFSDKRITVLIVKYVIYTIKVAIERDDRSLNRKVFVQPVFFIYLATKKLGGEMTLSGNKLTKESKEYHGRS